LSENRFPLFRLRAQRFGGHEPAVARPERRRFGIML
jgi:hypothetical protein